MKSKQLPTSTYVLFKEGTAERPVVTFTPDFKKILIGERITMACNAESASPTCSWYHNNIPVHTGETYVIPSAEMRHGGDYHCQTGDGDTSEIVTLNVTDGLVILQAPLYVYEGPVILQAPVLVYKGHDLALRCHSRPGDRVIRTTFYKDGDVIQPLPRDPGMVIIPTDKKQEGRYRCERTLSQEEYVTYTDEESLHIRELFLKPNLSTELHPAVEGDHMTLTCNTSLRPHRPRTQLESAFYRDGKEVKTFSSLNQYDVHSAQLEDSGKYSCDVRTPTGSVRKRSAELYIQIEELFLKPNLSTELHPAVEGDHMTLTCNTSLRPHRPRTQLESAFYRDGKEVKTFSSLNQYDVHSAQLEDSGKYSCDVRTPTGSVRKRSAELYIQIEGECVTAGTLRSKDGWNVQEFGSSNQYGVQSALPGDSGNYSCEVRTPTYSVNRRSQKISVQIKDYPSNTTTAIVAGLVSTTLLIILILGIVLVKKKFTSDEKRQTTGHQEAGDDIKATFKNEKDPQLLLSHGLKRSVKPEDQHGSQAGQNIQEKVSDGGTHPVLMSGFSVFFFRSRRTFRDFPISSPRGASEQADVFYTEIQFTREVPAASSASDEDSCYVNYTANQTASLPKVTEN
ncbi:PREDICTED: Fc receptor-like protein 3, partial [Nanorana parkeri]|uniref:Fc receptor-like protein 3 n=1 Tax=Nanorana parkeri TaxID=125878 RepID=UPI000854B642